MKGYTVISDSHCSNRTYSTFPAMKKTPCTVQDFPGKGAGHILQLLQQGQIDTDYAVILVHIGSNDMHLTSKYGHLKHTRPDPQATYDKIQSIVEEVKRQNPHAVVIISAVFDKPGNWDGSQPFITELNSMLRKTPNKPYHMIDTDRILRKRMKKSGSLYHADRLHLNQLGKNILAEEFEKTFRFHLQHVQKCMKSH